MQRGLTQQRSSPDDLAETQKKIDAAGGTFLFDLGDERRGNFERKFKDPRASCSTYRKMDGSALTVGSTRRSGNVYREPRRAVSR
jgi:hypothetical protein